MLKFDGFKIKNLNSPIQHSKFKIQNSKLATLIPNFTNKLNPIQP
jgi:hypothetical protein